MNRIFGLAFAAALALPIAAHANGILPFSTPRAQVRQTLKQEGFLTKGSGETLRIKTVRQPAPGKPGLLAVSVWAKGFAGSGRAELAQGKFKVTDVVDGELVSQVGKMHRIYMMARR